MKTEAKKGDSIKLITNDDFYKNHGFPNKNEGYKVTATEYGGVFIKEYRYLILHSDYEIVGKETHKF